MAVEAWRRFRPDWGMIFLVDNFTKVLDDSSGMRLRFSLKGVRDEG